MALILPVIPIGSPHMPQHPTLLWGSRLPGPFLWAPAHSQLPRPWLPPTTAQPSQPLWSFPTKSRWTHLLSVGKSSTLVRWSFGWSHILTLSSWNLTSICKTNCLRKLPESLGGLRKQIKLTSFVIAKLVQLILWEFNMYITTPDIFFDLEIVVLWYLKIFLFVFFLFCWRYHGSISSQETNMFVLLVLPFYFYFIFSFLCFDWSFPATLCSKLLIWSSTSSSLLLIYFSVFLIYIFVFYWL